MPLYHSLCLTFYHYSSSEIALALSHLTRHIQYLQSTAIVLIDGITTNQHILDSRVENLKAQELQREVNCLEDSVLSLQQHIIHLRCEVDSVSVRIYLPGMTVFEMIRENMHG